MPAVDASGSRLRGKRGNSQLKPQIPEPSNAQQPSQLKRTLCNRSEMPAWIQASPFILTGYRPITPTVRECVRSLTYVHNETGNIWSHLLGAVLFIGLIRYTWGGETLLGEHVKGVGVMDHIILGMFHFGTVFCLSNSALFHLLQCHSEGVFGNCMKLDYTGIVLAITCQFTAVIYYGFYCDAFSKTLYLGTFIGLSVFTIAVVTMKKFRTDEYRTLRVLTLLGFSSVPVIPIIHSIVQHGLEFTQRSMGLNHVGLMLCASSIGIPMFVFHFPERYFPVRFDIWGNSHLFWHVLIVVGMYFFYSGLMMSFNFWHGQNADCSVPLNQMDLGPHAWYWTPAMLE